MKIIWIHFNVGNPEKIRSSKESTSITSSFKNMSTTFTANSQGL